MTTLPERGTALVVGEGPPEPPAAPWLDVRPGVAGTFDGDRHRGTVVLRRGCTADGGPRRVDHAGLADVVGAVRERAVDGDAAAVRLGNRAALRRLPTTGSVPRLERRLVEWVGAADAALVVWTDGRADERDRRLYDAVVRR